MIEKIIKEMDGNEIYLKYDQDCYDIEYVELYKKIILKRLSDQKVIKIFDDQIGFIIQCNTGKAINFLVTSKRDDCGKKQAQFEHYIDVGHFGLKKIRTFPCSCTDLFEVRITDRSYLVDNNCIYNLQRKTERFKDIYHNQEVGDYFRENVLLVSEKIYGDRSRDDLSDTITYGMNSETYEIVTPIWSDLQQRFISLYTKEDVTKLHEEGKLVGLDDVGTTTICFEVIQYLYLLLGYIPRPASVYLDDNYHVNKEFVKKFVEK